MLTPLLLTAVITAQAPPALGLTGPLFSDPDTRVQRVERAGEQVTVVVGPAFFARSAAEEVAEQDRVDAVLGLLEEGEHFSAVRFLIEREDGELSAPPRRLYPPVQTTPQPPPLPGEMAWNITPPDDRFPYGAPLAGKTVAISAGHGWIPSGDSWGTQRPRIFFDGCGSCRGIVEDFSNNDLAARHLIPYLEGAGARVVVVRERDQGVHADLVDDGDDRYQEQGSFEAGTSSGGFDGDYRATQAGTGDFATYQLEVDAPGARLVSLYYRDGANRTANAVVDVTDGAGTTRYLADQRGFGRRFLPLGLHWFAPGLPAEVLVGPGGDDGALITDAVKIGGGVHAASGHPWWEMGASVYVAYAGAAADVLARGEVTVRPAYAEYVGADAYLSIHSNASGSTGTASGSTTYRFNCLSFADHTSDPPAADCDDPVGSDRLQELVQDGMVDRLRAEWDVDWCDRGTRVANFGEVRELVDTPGALVELAFHDNVGTATCSTGPAPAWPDNKSMHHPRFRRLLGYGLYEGLLEFLAPGATKLLEPPDHLVLASTDDGGLRVSWRAVADARGYRVQLARGGQAFDQGIDTEQTTLRFDDVAPLQAVCARVATLNEGGVGKAGATICGRARMARTTVAPAEVLLVDGFDRMDPWVQEIDNLQDATRRHALAIAAIQPFDAAVDAVQDEALLDGDVSLAGYRVVIFAFGLESEIHRTFTPELQALVEAFSASGGAVVASGAEIGFELWQTGVADDQTFVEGLFGASYQTDDGEAYQAQVEPGGLFDGLADVSFCCDGEVEHQSYDVSWPDAYTLTGGDSSAALSYPGGGAAAVVKATGTPALLLGFPFETVVGDDARRDLMERILALTAPDLPSGDLDLDTMADDWERSYGLDPADASDADEDLDGDGVSNAEEHAAGTDPTGGEGPYFDASVGDGAGGRDAGSVDAPSGHDGGGGGDTPPPGDCGCGCGGCGDDACEQDDEERGGCSCAARSDSGVIALGLLLLAWRRRPRARR